MDTLCRDEHASPTLILASASPRRAVLLKQLKLDFQQLTVDIDENQRPHEAVVDYVLRMAEEKAYTAWQRIAQQAPTDQRPVILAADTCGEIAGKLLSKPDDFSDAKRLLRLLSGQTHTIYSAFSLYDGKKMHTENVVSTVEFWPMTDEQITRYWQTGEPTDKAGAYAIQGLGAQFVKHLSGSYSAVMGLPLSELARALSYFYIRTL